MRLNDTRAPWTALCRLARKYGAQKPRSYTVAYDRAFSGWRKRPIRLLEIGVYRGGSLQMWREYFPHARLFAIDINPETLVWNDRLRDCQVALVDQGDGAALAAYAREHGPFDLVIDDGGHRMLQQLTSFEVLMPAVVPGGAYVIEDYGTSYLSAYGGQPLDAPGTSVALLKHLIDCINVAGALDRESVKALGLDEGAVPLSQMAGLRDDVEAMHIYRNLAMIMKRGPSASPSDSRRPRPLRARLGAMLAMLYAPGRGRSRPRRPLTLHGLQYRPPTGGRLTYDTRHTADHAACRH